MNNGVYDLGEGRDLIIRGTGIRSVAVKPLSYEMTVVSTGADDAVRAAGGWLCDRVRAGWHVSAVLLGRCDPRPLTILGVQTCTADDCVSLIKANLPAALAISADAFGDDQMPKLLGRALERKSIEVTIWGDEVPLALDGRVAEFRYRMSAAARTFKTAAVAAVGSSVREWESSVGDPFVERFHSHAPWYPPDGVDLVPCD